MTRSRSTPKASRAWSKAERGDGVGGERLALGAEAIEHLPPALQVGKLVDLRADPFERSEQAVAEVPLPPQPMDDLQARAPAGHDRDERPEQAVDAPPSSPQAGDLDAIARPEPAGKLFQAILERADVFALGGGLAQHLDQGRAAAASAGPTVRASPGSGRHGRSGSRCAWMPGLGRRPSPPAR